MPAYPVKILNITKSVMIVIWLLTSIMKDQMADAMTIEIDNDAIGYVVQHFYFFMTFHLYKHIMLESPDCL